MAGEFHEETTYTIGNTMLFIRDAGWRRAGLTSPDGNHNESGAESVIVASGQAIGLINARITRKASANLNSDAVPQKKDSNLDTNELIFGEVDLGSVENPVWAITGRMNLETSYAQTILKWLDQLQRTKGYKELGVPSDSTRNYWMLRWVYADNHNHSAYNHKNPADGSSLTTISPYDIYTGLTSLSHIHGRVKEVTFNQLGGDKFGWMGFDIDFIESL